MIEPPEARYINNTDEIQEQVRDVCEKMPDEMRSECADGGTVLENILTDLNKSTEDKILISSAAIEHAKQVCQELEQDELYTVFDNSEEKVWSDDEKREFTESMTGGVF